LALLGATCCPTPFWGRRQDRDRVADWLNRTSSPVVMWVSGAAGVGKTRFAAQCGLDAQQQGWVAGWLAADKGGQVLELVEARRAADPDLGR
jgi:ATP/maltotriose-dependent transcriptional regulator MalT